MKQPRSEIVGDVAKVLKCLRKRPQSSKIIPHPRQMGQIPFPDTLPGVLLWIGQDRFGLIQEAVGMLKRWPELRCDMQAFGQELV